MRAILAEWIGRSTRPVVLMPLPLPQHLDQACDASGVGSLHALNQRVPVARPIQLEKGGGSGGGDVHDRLRGEDGQSHDRAPRRSGPGDGDLAVGMYRLNSCWTDDDRRVNSLPKDSRCLATPGLLADDVGCKPELAKRGLVRATAVAVGH